MSTPVKEKKVGKTADDVAPEAKLPAVAGAAQLPAEMVGALKEDAGRGVETAISEDIALPFIKCAQKMSDEIDDSKAAFIPGLKEGDFFNTVSHEIWPAANGFDFIPVFYQRKYLEWGPERGDGFKGEHGPEILEKCTRDENNILRLPDGNQVTIAATWYGYQIDTKTGAVNPAVISLSSTQLKKSRQLMFNLKAIRHPNPDGKGSFAPPIFASVLHITSTPESNDKGSWRGWKFDIKPLAVLSLPGGTDIYAHSKRLYEQASQGILKTAQPAQDDFAASEETGEELDD